MFLTTQVLLIIALCVCSSLGATLWAEIRIVREDRENRLSALADLAKLKADFTDMLSKAAEANNSHAKEIMRLGDLVAAHEMMLRQAQGSKR